MNTWSEFGFLDHNFLSNLELKLSSLQYSE